MTRFALVLVGLLFPLLAAADAVPSPDEIGGLRRAGFLGVAVGPPGAPPAVQAVVPGGSAEKIGLQAGDVIVSLDDQPVADSGSFVAAIGRKRAGDAVALSVRRGDQTLNLRGTLVAARLEKQAGYDIDYGNVAVDGAKRRTIVTRPGGPGKHPAVLLIGGIGCYALDGLLRPAELKQPYAKLLDALTRDGYVTMRVEKTGMGDSEGVPCQDPRADFDAEVRGYAAGLKQLESMKQVDGRNVFLFAHSIGPLIAARIAAEHPVRGIAMAETVGTGWLEYDLANTRRQLLLAGVPYDEVERGMRHHEICAHRFYVEKQKPEQILAADKACAEDLKLPAPYLYLQQVGALDLAALWKKIDAPALLFYGSADFVTDAYQHEYLRDLINAFHPGHAKYVPVEGMDHGLTITGTQKASFEGKPDAPAAQQVIDETLRFFKVARTG